MKRDTIVIGPGQIGAVYAHGLLRLGLNVHPVTRRVTIAEQAERVAEPELVVVSVGEAELSGVLSRLPASWRSAAVLVQNELVPDQWERHGLKPTVNVVWFEKKPGTGPRTVLSSAVWGPKRELVLAVYGQLGIPIEVVETEQGLVLRLVQKNLYILTINLAGLDTGGTTASLWNQHRPKALAVAREVLDLQSALTGQDLDREGLLRWLEHALIVDPNHTCTGRSAPSRLARTLKEAARLGVPVPALRELANRVTPPEARDHPEPPKS
jgi:hypothetical protein